MRRLTTSEDLTSACFHALLPMFRDPPQIGD